MQNPSHHRLMHHSWVVENSLQVGFEVLQVLETQNQTWRQMRKRLAFEMVVDLGVVMLYVRQPMTMRRKDRWRVVKVLQLAVSGEE